MEGSDTPNSRKMDCLKLQSNLFDGSNLSLSEKSNSILYLHPSAMAALTSANGDWALIRTNSGSLILKLFSHDSVKAECAAFHSSIFKYYESSTVSVLPLNSSTEAAKEVYLIPEIYRNFMNSLEFQAFVSKILRHIYIRKGLVLNINYLGYNCLFTVKYITPIIEKSEINNNELQCNKVNFSEEFDGDDSGFETMQTSTPISSRKDPTKIFRNGKKQMCEEKFYFLHSQSKIILKQSKPDSCISFKDIIALEEVIKFIKLSISSILQSDFGPFNVFPNGILLVGSAGSGKSMISKALKKECSIPVHVVECKHIKSSDQKDNTGIERIFEEAVSCYPSVLYFDDLDIIFKNDSPLFKEEEFLRNFKSHIYKTLNYTSNVLVIASTTNVNLIPPCMRKNGFFSKELHLNISSQGRKQVFLKILKEHKCMLSESEINEIIDDTSDFSGGQLQHLCDLAKELFLQDPQRNPEDFPFRLIDLKKSLKQIKPTVPFNFEIPNVKWSDIGGMKEVKEALEEMISWPLKLSHQFTRFKITPSRGILMYGPPGCCKTMIAKALVTEENFNFIPVKASELFNKYVGESEKTVSDLFKRARTSAPCVLFFDEIDSLTSTRNSTSGSSNVTERILTQLLTEIDGIEPLNGVSILAATNRPDIIDPSFLRPGRFDHMIYVPLPDSDTRREIFDVKLRKMLTSDDVNATYLVNATEGYSGAEITEICRIAAKYAIKENAESVSMKHFTKSLKEILPQTSEDMKQLFEKYEKQRTSYFS